MSRAQEANLLASEAISVRLVRDIQPDMSEIIAVMGLGYVGLPVALAFAKKFPTVGFDIDVAKVKELVSG